MAYIESDQRACTRCKCSKFVREFHRRTINGQVYPKTRCRKCENLLRHKRETKSDRKRLSSRAYARLKKDRWSRKNQARFILLDAKGSDRKRGFENDLTPEFVHAAIVGGCSYCGIPRDETVMSLDRVDLTKGHLQSNVIASCDNCNLTRGTMPYEAWLLVAKAVRNVRDAGLLAGWNRRNRRR